MNELEKLVILSWGSEEEFYKERARFCETHKNTQCIIEFDSELNMPIRAVYTFPPISVAYEKFKLIEALKKKRTKGHDCGGDSAAIEAIEKDSAA